MATLNYKHLHYFWAVAKAGSVTLAGKQLHVTPQTISGQLSLFEEVLGGTLFNRAGRRFELTDRGEMVLSYADKIFSLGQELEDALRLKQNNRPLQFKIGVCDSVPKSIAYRLIAPALDSTQPLHVICKEGNITNLLSELAVHKLDIVISDSPMPPNVNVRAFNHLLGECGLAFFASSRLAKKLANIPFPECLNGAPMLLPSVDDAVRPNLMLWLDSHNIRPNVIGEFDDSALMKAFGQAGVGVYTVPTATANQVDHSEDIIMLGATKDVTKSFYAISIERKLTHPAVITISEAAKHGLFL